MSAGRPTVAAAWLAFALVPSCVVIPTTKPTFQVDTTVDNVLTGSPPVWSLDAQGQPKPVGALQTNPVAQPTTQDPGAGDAARLRARFGSTILMKPDGRITKQYFVSGEASGVLRSLVTEPGGTPPPPNRACLVGGAAQPKSILSRMLGDNQVELLHVENFETIEGVRIAAPVVNPAVTPAQSATSNSLLLATAQPVALAAFEGALNLFFAHIPQVEIEVKVVEYSTSQSLGLGVDQVGAGTPNAQRTVANQSSKQLVQGIVSRFPLAPTILGGTIGEKGVFTLGGIHDGWQLAARLEALETRGVADVISSPRMVVRNGGTASVNTQTELPYPQAQISSSGQNITANIVFKPVGVMLNIRPVIAGTETVILQIYASVAAVTSFAATTPVPTPIISSREVMTSVHVTSGKTAVIGGLISKSTLESETKVPLLGDLPVLGWLFRSTQETASETTLEFHITPRILQGPRGFQQEVAR